MAGFGAELQARRLAADMSLGELSKRVFYSKGHLSKVENGRKQPSHHLAKACDRLFGAGGALERLVPPPAATDSHTPDDGTVIGSQWRIDMSPAGVGTLHIGSRQTWFAAADGPGDLRGVFEAMRRWGRAAPPAAVLAALVPQLHLVRSAVSRAVSGPHRTHHMTLGARMSEFAGWMAQEAGDVPGALRWTDLAAQLARDVGMADMADHVLVRRALVAMYQGKAEQTVELASRARQRSSASPRMRFFAALREAQGYALAGDQDGCERALDWGGRFSALMDSADEGQELGPGTQMDILTVVRAWCLHDLGRHREAAELLDREVPRIPVTSSRSFARYAARRAMAHLSAGDVDRACELMSEVLDHARIADSATVRAELAAFAAMGRRWPRHPALRRLRPRLTAELAGQTTAGLFTAERGGAAA